MKKFTSLLMCTALLTSALPVPTNAAESATATVEYKYGLRTYERQMEKLDRGLIAVKTSNGVYVGWRMSAEEGSVKSIRKSPSFDVYRNGQKIATVEDSTNYLDASGKSTDSYSVAIKGETACEAVSVMSNNYLDITMDVPSAFVLDEETSYSYSIGDTSCGDVDGDGEYELVVKWDCNPQDNSNGGVTGNVYLDAYKLDGTKLWRIDLGRNIRSGAHYTQFLVYDFDLDGIAEITAKTAPGSIDGKGKYVTEASLVSDIKDADNTAVYVNDGGWVIEGDEFFTVFDGKTGAALDTIYYPIQRISARVWGDAYGNRCDRFLADVAYLDGENPYAVYWRGYYGGQSGYGARTGIFAARLTADKRLDCKYCFDTYDTTTVENYKGIHAYMEDHSYVIGQGNHNMTVADVDDDGKDEFLSGALCFEITDEDKLDVKWCSNRGHGDALHIGNYDPTHDGLEYFSVHESSPYGMTVYDAGTGEELYHHDHTKDTGRGVMANIGSGGYYQISGATNVTAYGNGEFAETSQGPGSNFRVFWNADLYDDILDCTSISAWNGSYVERIFSAADCVQVNGTKANPALQADLFGDWREEVCYPLSDNKVLRVFTTTDVTEYKLPTLMHDPVYRSGVAAEQTAYNQPPHIGFYLSEELFNAQVTGIEIKTYGKTEYNVGEKLDMSDFEIVASYDDDTTRVITDYKTAGFNSMSVGKQKITVIANGYTTAFDVNVVTDFVCDDNGYIIGYNGNAEIEKIPESIDGVNISGIASGAIEDTSIKTLYIYDNVSTMEENSVADVTIYCIEGSSAYVYAVENDLQYVLIDMASYDYVIDIDFEEEAFGGLYMTQTNEGQTLTVDGLQLAVGSRSPSGDGKTGYISQVDESGNTYLHCGAGRFHDKNRNAYMSFNALTLSNENDVVLSFDFEFPYMTNSSNEQVAVTANVADANGTIDTISIANLGVETDAWYKYELICSDGEYVRVLRNGEGEVVSVTSLGKKDAGTFVSTISFYLDTTYGGVGNREGAYMAVDNFKLYTTESAVSNVAINVKNIYGEAVSNATVASGIFTKKTNSGGTAEFVVPNGVYTFGLSADGYEDATIKIVAYGGDVAKTAVIMREGEEPTPTPTVEPTETPAPEVTETPEPVQVVKITAEYDESGRLISVWLEDIEITGDEVFESTETVKIFIWKSIESMIPWEK